MTRIFWSLLAVFSLNTVFLQAATVSWSQDNVLLQEAVGTGSFGLTLSAASSNNLTVSYAVTNGTAIAGGLDIDLPTSGTVVIGAGNTTASLSFGVIADNVIETLLETLSVKLTAISGNTDYTVGSTNTLTLSIQDDDSTGNLEVLWGWDSRTNYESDLVSAIPVFLSRASSATVSVNVAITGSVNISDYGSPTTTLTFAPGVTKAYYYPAFINDSVVESTETMVLTLNNASGANINSGHTTFTYTILDDDDTPTLEIITGSGVVTEGNSAYVYFRLSHPISQNVTFYASSADGTASSGNDFTFTSGNMTIYAGSLETYAYVTIPRDGLAEGNETFQINISTPSNASLGSSTSAQLTILDKVPEVYAYFPQTSRSEHEGSVTLYVSIYDGVASKDNIVVYLSPSGNATAGSDYTLATNVTIPAGSVYTTLSIPLIDDSVVESDETLTINLTSAANANIRANYPVPTLTILDNDTTPLVSLTTYYSSITEGSSVLPIVYLSLNRYYSGNVVTQISYTGNATLGTDYTLSAGNTTVIVPANSFSSSYVYLTPIDDVTNEGNEIITVDLTSAANATLTSSNTTNINLIDNDNGSQEAVLKLYSSSLSIKEAGSTVSYFRVYLNQPSSNNITYVIGSVGGNATLLDDYTLSTNTLSVPAGSTLSSFYITITAKSDNLNEYDETAILGITSASQGLISSSNTLTFTIEDNNATPLVYFPNTTSSFYENGGYRYQYVYLDKVYSGNVTAIVAQTSGNAVLGTDYTLSSNTVTFTSGQQNLGFYIQPINNTLIDGTRSLVLTLTSTGNATTGSGNSLTASILDNEKPNLYLYGYSIEEGSNSSYQFYMYSDVISDLPVYGNLEITGGTATLGSDYSLKAQSFTLAAGSSYQYVDFGVIDDDIAESSETMVASISQLVNATTLSANATGTITDNDAEPTVSINTSYYNTSGNTTSVTEGTTAYIYVALDRATNHDVYVDYSATGGTATRTLDYGLAATNRIRITAGSIYNYFYIYGVDDIIDEPNETAIIQISKVTGAKTTSAGNTFTLTVLDNDEPSGPVLNFAYSSSSVISTTGGANIGVTLNQAQTANITYQVSVNSANTTAVSGTDYTFTSQVSTLTAGNTSAQASVVILNGSNAGGSSVIQFELRASSGANVGNTATHILSIVRTNSVGVNAVQTFKLPAYTGAVDYRMVGLPMVNLTAKTLLDKLGNYLGAQGDFTWQVYNYQAKTESYQVVSASSNMQSGDGFWIASVAPVSQSIALTAPESTATIKVDLEAGWNIIANPFTTSLTKSNLSVSFGGNGNSYSFTNQTATSSTLWTYTVSSGNASYTSANTLAAGEAAWLYAWSGNTVTLSIIPSSMLGKSELTTDKSVMSAPRQEPYPPAPPSGSAGTSTSSSGGGCLIKSASSKETVQ